MGHTKEAIEAFQAAVRLGPSKPGWLVDLGLSLYTDGRLDAALEMYDKALEPKPDFARAYCNKAVVYWRKGDDNQAWLNVDKCGELGEEPPRGFVQKLMRDSGRQPPPGGADPEAPEKGKTQDQP
jgi:tetratricopeptide (TPR) repeat protein